MQSVFYYLQNPAETFQKISDKIIFGTAPLWPDRLYIETVYKRINHVSLNLDSPQTFNEKLNWLKLYNQNPLYTKLADKYLAKEYVAGVIGEEYVVRNYGVWKTFDEIDFDSLPDRFILKATHDSGGVTICRDKSQLDMLALKIKFDRILKTNYFYKLREWVYKNAEPKIIADELLDDHSGHELTDYKFWCFNGEAKIMYITNKGENIYENFYDMDYTPIDINHGYPRRFPEYTKPQNFELMKSLAAKLSKDIPFVRVDFFDIDGKVYFGEFTFYDWAGMKSFVSKDWDKLLGDWIKLPIVK